VVGWWCDERGKGRRVEGEKIRSWEDETIKKLQCPYSKKGQGLHDKPGKLKKLRT
jgi:hypothetical protein